MKKWLIIVCSLVAAIGAGTALADLNYTQGTGTVIFDFICFSTKHCPSHVLIDSTGTEKGTGANPVVTSVTPGVNVNSFSTGAVAVGSFASGSITSGAFSTGSIGIGAFATGSISGGAFTSGAFGVGSFNTGTFNNGAFGVSSIGVSAFAANSISTAAFATGAVASGAFATGSLGPGALAFGAGVDGWNQTEGAKADAAWTAGSGSIVALLKAISTAELADPCNSAVKTNVPISAAVTATQVVAGVSSKKVYACSLILATTASTAVSLVEGTGTQCATANQAAVIGAVTPSTGGITVTGTNGSILIGNGKGSIAFTATAANGLCLYQSTTPGILAGNLTYVQQ